MADDKNKQGAGDRSQVSGSEDYEVSYMAEKMQVSPELVRAAITAVGNERDKVEAYLEKSRGGE